MADIRADWLPWLMPGRYVPGMRVETPVRGWPFNVGPKPDRRTVAQRGRQVRTIDVQRPALRLRQNGPNVKFYVKHADRELMFPSFKDFQTMYRLKFVAPDDMVRRENSERWVRVGDMPELRLTHSETYGAGLRFSQMMWLFVGVITLVMMFQLFFKLKPMLPENQPPAAPAKSAH